MLEWDIIYQSPPHKSQGLMRKKMLKREREKKEPEVVDGAIETVSRIFQMQQS